MREVIFRSGSPIHFGPDYRIARDRLILQFTFLRYGIRFEDIERIEIHPPGIVDFMRLRFRNWFAFNWDLTALARHLVIVKKGGIFRKHKICPREPDVFYSYLNEAWASFLNDRDNGAL